MRQLYTLLLYLLLPVMLLWLWLKPSQRASLAQRLGFYRGSLPVYYWVHAASVGEVLAARPLIEAMLERFPERKVVVTTFTPTGTEFVKTSFADRVQHAYLPLDIGPCIQRFLRRFRPRCAIFLETELWPNMLYQLQRQETPLVIANGRISPATAKYYRHFASLFRPILAGAEIVAAQSQADTERYAALGVRRDHLRVLGNLKYDLALPDNTQQIADDLRQSWGDRPVLLAASTREGEEAQLLELLPRLQRNHPDLLLVLVPRHPQRFDEVAQLIKKRGFSLQRRSNAEGASQLLQVYLGDTLGELPGFYAAADVIFIGGSLVPLGGHNPLEAAAVGKAVIVGPHTFNFNEVYTRLLQQHAVQRADDSPGLATLIEQQLSDSKLRVQMGDRAKAVMEQNRGGVQATLELIAKVGPADHSSAE